ncbi:acyl-CoA dehydrogenase [Sandaracinus amylolyticus]|uniref:acyl-CoA dehydrogenase n=1 Tax=Sandaracinus amylolyticus TaxID=927083 RepID=UPI001F2CC7EA|nr:acyl-CoA dehydrogenase [Sandaracinus amylolyticus]UJR79652.1 Acyl-CoA dehydrogenase, short-chain specific [Sandaracinus amylolyticus]
MSQAQNRYKADLRELQFLVFEQFGLRDLLSKEPFAAWGEDEVRMVLDETYKFATEVLGPLNSVGDREKCKLIDGKVKTPTGFPDAWKKLYEAGWRQLSGSEEFGGQGAPRTLQVLVEEMFSGANVAFMMYPGLSLGAAELIDHCGTDEQRKQFAARMYAGKWGGTMCLTEPHAGSDVGAARTTAKALPDGTYKIQGTKIFISGGDHDCADNIVHLVLARIDGAEAGTKGLSLFIVPKYRVDANGNLGAPNDVKVASIEHKMGINGSATCVMQFGEEDKCVGVLVGGVPHQGMKQMFQMMNYARIGVGIQGLAIAGAAYLSALEYAKDRKQGSSITAWKDPTAPRVAIIDHPDVRRMLLGMKAKVEGIRALIVKLSMHQDRATALGGKNDEQAAYHQGQVELLTPIVKAYASDQSFRVCEDAIQVYGGAGYCNDYPVEQYLRDSKIFSIYEGTNHIQALDLVGRKLGQAGGKHTQEFFADIGKFVSAKQEDAVLGASVKNLAKAQEAVGSAAFQFLGWFKGGEMAKVPLNANRFLEMMSELAVGWLLLEGAAIAADAQSKLTKDQKDWFFYEGKKQAAIFYAQNVLPEVVAKAKMLGNGDKSALEIPDEAFATV